MIGNRKTIVDENNNAVVVIIPIEEWEKIEKMLQESLISKSDQFKESDLSEFFGIIQLREDPLEFQKWIRSEWDRDES